MKQNEPAVHFTFSLILIMELSLKKGCSAFSLLMGSTDEAYRKVKKKIIKKKKQKQNPQRNNPTTKKNQNKTKNKK